MKTRSYKLLFLLFLSFSVFVLPSCASSEGQQHDEIVFTAIRLANKFISNSMYEEALDTYDRALKEASDYRLTYNKALVLAYMKRYEEAAQLCDQGFTTYPYIMSFKKAQYEFLGMNNDSEGQAEVLNQILEINPYDRKTRENLIQLYITQNKTSDAINHATWLFEHGFTDNETIKLLYSLEPGKWKNLYNSLNEQKTE